jgi:hypothetical protein
MRSDSGELLQGPLGILILKALLSGPTHGYGVGRWVEIASAVTQVLRTHPSVV